ncbi:DarT ssDNA thymidine ADP-ribosyltransferase family protein [Tunicatimonas pelagia]|uniref:DarT ssDNA thymidine ADP-ribosyltransferase family protein n=1 Tax=Tunicatimonas pelagia TaxID=931531 RepID=UPI00345DEFF1
MCHSISEQGHQCYTQFKRKQAEFLVFKELPLSALIGVIVHSEAAKRTALTKFAEYNFTCSVIVKPNFYY